MTAVYIGIMLGLGILCVGFFVFCIARAYREDGPNYVDQRNAKAGGDIAGKDLFIDGSIYLTGSLVAEKDVHAFTKKDKFEIG